jgi:hypothetical protein
MTEQLLYKIRTFLQAVPSWSMIMAADMSGG